MYLCVGEDAPVISCPQLEHTVPVGVTAVLSCSVSANPGSLLTWARSVDGKLTDHITDPTINVSIKVSTFNHCHIILHCGQLLGLTVNSVLCDNSTYSFSSFIQTYCA